MNAQSEIKKIRCKNCGKLFLPKRPWQKFHNNHCRVQYHRMPGTLKERISKIERELKELNEQFEIIKSSLNSLKKSIELLDKAIKKSPV